MIASRIGARYWAHSFAVSAAVTLATAPIIPQMTCSGLEKFTSENAPVTAPPFG